MRGARQWECAFHKWIELRRGFRLNPRIMKQTEKQRREIRLDCAFKASNEGLWEWEIGSPKVFYSPRVLNFFDYTEKTAPNIFTDPASAVHEDDLEEFQQKLEKILADPDQELFAVDARIRKRDGEWCWMRIRGVPVRDESGKITSLAGSIIDITRRKKAEEKWQEDRHLLRLLIENVPVNIYFKDKNSHFILANTATAEKLGAGTVDELLGKSDYDFFDTVHADKSRDDEVKIMETGKKQLESLNREIWRDKDDTWVLTTKLPWKDRKGRIKGTFGVTNDVTELVRMQQQIEKTHRALEEELQLAREIQQALIPSKLPPFPKNPAPDTPQLHFAQRYLPGSGLAGDFFEITPLSDTAVTIFICDVMGHGVRSALVVSMLRGLMGKGREVGDKPAALLESLNRGLAQLLAQVDSMIFATAFYGVIDLEAREFRYACAGHPAPIARFKDSAGLLPIARKIRGPALGLRPDSTYKDSTQSVDNLESLLLYTDGLTEAENQADEQFGDERLIQSIRKAHGTTPEQLLDQVMADVRGFTGGNRFDDDVCLVAIQCQCSE
jgi:sigma-B regulation protein RsbU (phosphoserine phosphatase)